MQYEADNKVCSKMEKPNNVCNLCKEVFFNAAFVALFEFLKSFQKFL